MVSIYEEWLWTDNTLNWAVGSYLVADSLNNNIDNTCPPIGGVVGWIKSFTGVPQTLPAGWMECNGSTISDSDSPLDGVTVPDFTGSFLMGGSTSGTVGGTDQHRHGYVASAGNFEAAGGVTVAYVTHIPSYYEVVYIMRYKGGTTKWNTSGQLTFAKGEVLDAGSLNTAIDEAFIPIGGIVGWDKHLPGTPGSLTGSMPEAWMECNGSTISDADSPLNGETLPDLNAAAGGTQRFLRGMDTSGTTGGVDTHTHGTTGGGGPFSTVAASKKPSTVSNLPPYYETVWITRIK